MIPGSVIKISWQPYLLLSGCLYFFLSTVGLVMNKNSKWPFFIIWFPIENSEFLFPWKDALYALYNINFQLLPPCLSELDVNWPQSNIRAGRAQTLPNPVATPTLPDYNIEEDKGTEVKIVLYACTFLLWTHLWPHKVQNWLRKSSGIGSTSVSEREIETAQINNETEKAELEVKQEFMARVITDLEMKNTELETKECYSYFELKCFRT